MKTSLLAALSVAALALTACDKKPNEAPTSSATSSETASSPSSTRPAPPPLSSNNVADIKNDLIEIQTLSNNRSKAALNLQNKANQAAQNNDKPALHTIVAEMKTYIANFNRDLDDLALKSSELDAVRDKIKESNNLGIELSEESIANKPDTKKIAELQKRAAQLQKELVTEMQALENKVKTAS